MRYLVAVDGFEHSRHALAFARDQAAESGATLDVAYVVDEEGGDPDAKDQIRETVAEVLDDSGVEYELHFPETSKRTQPARHVGERILEFAREQNVDAIYVGNEETGPAQRMIVGSVAQTVVGDRSIPVILVP